MPTWLQHPALLITGIILLLAGGDVLVRAAVAISKRLAISPLVVGLTVVAFGTSAPELALNAAAALNGNTDLSFGNIVGSNIANIGLILGVSALIKPMRVNSALLKREIPIMLAVSALVAAAAYTPPHAGSTNGFARPEGVALLVGFVLFLEMMRRTAKKGGADELTEDLPDAPSIPLPFATVLFFIGLAMLALGGALAEKGAVGVAQAVGLSDAAIGLTVVAVATSLPELATSVMAARRGLVDIAVGNVVGSNIFNLLLVLAATATIAPTAVPPGGARSLAAMMLLAIFLVPMSKTDNGFISRVEGAVLLALYAAAITLELVYA